MAESLRRERGHAEGLQFAPSVTRRLIEEFARRAVSGPRPAMDGLTDRETEVLVHVARG